MRLNDNIPVVNLLHFFTFRYRCVEINHSDSPIVQPRSSFIIDWIKGYHCFNAPDVLKA